MKTYLAYVPEDTAFAKKLTNDLQTHNIEVVWSATDSEAELQALRETPTVLVALSEASVHDARVLTTLKAAAKLKARIIGLRIGTVDELPDELKGVLPLNFTSDEDYQDSLDTLLDDLKPPSSPNPILPNNLQERLESNNPAERRQAIEEIGQIRNELDESVHALAQQLLRDIAFRDPESSVKSVARTILQLLGTSGEAQSATPQEPVAAHSPAAPTTPPTEAPSAVVSQGMLNVPLWNTLQWWSLPIVGVLLAVLQALAVRKVAFALPLALVWILLPWLNVTIRDGGRLDWKMPGPVIGTGGIALLLGGIGIGIGTLLEDLETLDVVTALGLSILYGGFIGWLSSMSVTRSPSQKP
ncbi:MAG: TIR domain-containing protein [Chloroflexi bacterium]|nr:TIR domain-containing protein [Chloroflexota bacterium]